MLFEQFGAAILTKGASEAERWNGEEIGIGRLLVLAEIGLDRLSYVILYSESFSSLLFHRSDCTTLATLLLPTKCSICQSCPP